MLSLMPNPNTGFFSYFVSIHRIFKAVCSLSHPYHDTAQSGRENTASCAHFIKSFFFCYFIWILCVCVWVCAYVGMFVPSYHISGVFADRDMCLVSRANIVFKILSVMLGSVVLWLPYSSCTYSNTY